MKNKGFTLIELLIASGIFAIVVVIVSAVFVSAINTQRDILAAKKVLGQVGYLMEFTSRALRMAVKDTGEGCLNPGENYAYHSIYGNQGIRFRNALQDGECQEFYLEDGHIKMKRDVNGFPTVLDLTSSDIEIVDFEVILNGQSQGDDFQPLVTLNLWAKAGRSPLIKIQTSVSQRNLDLSI